ncbi:3-hydroxyisobutyrate dehydrogenase [Endozoicomonas numazuensis]|uniref:3-hydroxyisobutyrate dehydrogenase n=1 Tax=Endozoicomonas numazuensis TaxID=1137799 RepID=A0A081NJG9_9GAMM|nr:3-hydroxyisobutyrate dehydrogenase [Endozoicomonas numazuensis]KEQ18592.1 3-hydroxyisobutyrate dehydrogenase [Endozoicomonas numazuensis]
MATVGFIGLGNMGAPMAANLVKAGHEVSVFDLVPEAVKALASQGAKAAASAEQACSGAEFVISMLPAGKHVESLYLTQGLLESVPASAIFIDTSTIDTDTARKLSAAAAEKGKSMVDAPVSGGVAGAAAGTLSFMCGASDPAVFDRVKPLLLDMGKNVFLAGGPGAGQVAKACNNMLLSILMIGTSEALNLGTKNGLDPAVLSDIMLASSGKNWALEVYNPYPDLMENAPASKDYEPGFMSELMLKDLGLAMAAAGGSNAVTPLGGLAYALYNRHVSQGMGKKDFSSIFQAIESLRPEN